MTPSLEKTNLATFIYQPDHCVEIEVRLRDNGRGNLEVKLSESKIPMEVSVEDIAATEMGAY